MAGLPLMNGWEIGWSQDVLVATIERGDSSTNSAFNVAFAMDAEEAALFLEQEIDELTRNWEGSEQDLEFIYAFIRRFRK